MNASSDTPSGSNSFGGYSLVSPRPIPLNHSRTHHLRDPQTAQRRRQLVRVQRVGPVDVERPERRLELLQLLRRDLLDAPRYDLPSSSVPAHLSEREERTWFEMNAFIDRKSVV